MTLRFSSLLAAAAMAALAAPALAQDGYDPGPPPPLPAWDEVPEDYGEEEYVEEEEAWEEHAPPHARGYPPEQRAAWLEECRARHHGPHADHCEAYLLHYEQSYFGHGPSHGAGAWGYHYPYPYPVMWVKVPIVTERGDCGCDTLIEERVEVESAPPPVRRRPAPDKRIRITK